MLRKGLGRKLLVVLVVLVGLSLIFILAGERKATGSSEEEGELKPVEITIWWWGEQEAPGAQEWMHESFEMPVRAQDLFEAPLQISAYENRKIILIGHAILAPYH